MPRTYLVSGSASGIGRATAELLRARGHTVIGVDLHNADIAVDLTTPEGRAAGGRSLVDGQPVSRRRRPGRAHDRRGRARRPSQSRGTVRRCDRRGPALPLEREGARAMGQACCPAPDWAGAGIALNAIAPGEINTPMSAEMLATEQGRQTISAGVPMPLNGFAEPTSPAHLLAWLAGVENTHLCGHVIFIDGGSEVLARGDAVC